MSDKIQISINDFNLFCEVMKSTSKIVESAKLYISPTGLSIYGAKDRMARCEVTSNSIFSETEIDISILELNKFVKILQTIIDIHENDYNGFKFIIEKPFIRFESKKFKTKITTVKDDIIEKWTSKKIEGNFNPVFEFITNSNFIKRVNTHSYISDEPDKMRIYIEQNDEMEKNSVYATIGNKSNNLNNEMTLKVGLITLGSLEDKQIILDLNRLNTFNTFQSNEIKIGLMPMNFLVGEAKLTGKNNSYFNLKILCTTLKN